MHRTLTKYCKSTVFVPYSEKMIEVYTNKNFDISREVISTYNYNRFIFGTFYLIFLRVWFTAEVCKKFGKLFLNRILKESFE